MSPESFELQFGTEQLTRLRRLAVVPDPPLVTDLGSAEARRHLAETDVLFTSWGAPPLTPEVLEAAPRLRAVLHCAGSVRLLLTPRVHERGIVVSTAAAVNARPVAEYTLAAIIMAGKKAPFLARGLPHAGWEDVRDRRDLSNRGRRVGIIGLSRIGRRVMELLELLDTAEILVYDPYADPGEVAALGGRLATLDELLTHSEIASLHAPLLPETRAMIGERELALLPDGATLINTARGALVDHEALTAACASGRVNAILDVTDPEPLPADSRLHTLDNVFITPHVAGSLGSETRRMSDHALDELERWLRGRPLQGLLAPSAAAVTA